MSTACVLKTSNEALKVVQYILDLNDNRFSDGVIRQFMGNVCALSVQKFSSNVIEKCIRVAEHSTRKMLIDELLNRSRLEKLLRDSYGNYCVQVRNETSLFLGTIILISFRLRWIMRNLVKEWQYVPVFSFSYKMLNKSNKLVGRRHPSDPSTHPQHTIR